MKNEDGIVYNKPAKINGYIYNIVDFYSIGIRMFIYSVKGIAHLSDKDIVALIILYNDFDCIFYVIDLLSSMLFRCQEIFQKVFLL